MRLNPKALRLAPSLYGDLPPQLSAKDQMFPLDQARADVIVVGGGIAGLTAALSLAKAGVRVSVIEKERIGAGASGRSGGQLWPAFQQSFSDLKAQFGLETAVALYECVDRGLQRLHQRLDLEASRCTFQKGVLLLATNKNEASALLSEALSLEQAGFTFGTYLSAEDVRNNHVGSAFYQGALLYTGSEKRSYGHFNPLQYTLLLARLAIAAGVNIYEKTELLSLTSSVKGYSLKTSNGDTSADGVIIAGGYSFLYPQHDKRSSLWSRHTLPAETLILATEPIAEDMALSLCPQNECFADMRTSAMNYGRLIKDVEGRWRFTLGGADALMQMQTHLAAYRLRAELYRLFPQLKKAQVQIEHAWSGFCDLSYSSLPVALELAPKLYQLCGFSGHGNVLTGVLAEATAAHMLSGENADYALLQTLSKQHKRLSTSKTLAQLQMLSQLWR